MPGKHSTPARGKSPENRSPEQKPAVAYYRVSTEKQESLPTQRAWAARVTQRDGLGLVGEFDDEGISGGSFDRPGLQSLIDFVEQRFYARDPVQSLVVLDLDRLSRRNSMDTSALLGGLSKHGLHYIVMNSQLFDLRNPLDRTLIALGSDFTREPELRARSNHVLNGMAERARQGLWMGGPIPYGYRLGDDGRLAPGPEEEQEVVRWIFSTYASGRLTATGIAREFGRRGILTRRGKAGWSRHTVLKMLTSRNYIGCVVWGER
jgi:DNA invertase Pin-like site-specific DNA recombinase